VKVKAMTSLGLTPGMARIAAIAGDDLRLAGSGAGNDL